MTKPQLEEISIMRPILICICLLVYHSFAPFGGVDSWSLYNNLDVPAYFWLDKFVFSFMLEGLVFISGYVFSFQLYTQAKDYNLLSLLNNKFKRLIIPSLFFSVFYILFFYEYPKYCSDYQQLLYEIISGAGHLWFCPMLFWCFFLSFILLKVRLDERKKIFLLLLLSLFSFLPLPFQLDQACYFLFFFYLGIFGYKEKGRIIINLSRKPFLFVLLLYFFSFIILTFFRESLFDYRPCAIGGKVIKYLLYRGSMITYSLLGLLGLLLFSIRIVSRGFHVPQYVIKLNQICMGIYIFHQFILKFLYFHSILPEWCGYVVLPWVGYVIAILSSIALSIIIRLTAIGRRII